MYSALSMALVYAIQVVRSTESYIRRRSILCTGNGRVMFDARFEGKISSDTRRGILYTNKYIQTKYVPIQSGLYVPHAESLFCSEHLWQR